MRPRGTLHRSAGKRERPRFLMDGLTRPRVAASLSDSAKRSVFLRRILRQLHPVRTISREQRARAFRAVPVDFETVD